MAPLRPSLVGPPLWPPPLFFPAQALAPAAGAASPLPNGVPSFALAPRLAGDALSLATARRAAVLGAEVSIPVHQRRAAAAAKLLALLGVPSFEALGAAVGAEAHGLPGQVTLYLSERMHLGGRRAVDPAGNRFMVIGTLKDELAALRNASYPVFGKVPWNPRGDTDGNPFLAAEVDTFMAGAQKFLYDRGIVSEPAVEAYPAQVAEIVSKLRLEAAAAGAAGSPATVQLLQIVYMVLAGYLWGDRVDDVVQRDFEDVRLCHSPADAASLLPAGSLDLEGHTVVVPASGGFVVVTYNLDKGAKASGDPAIRIRRQLYAILGDTEMCPLFALGALSEQYRLSLLTWNAADSPALGHADSGPVIKAFRYQSPKDLRRIASNTFDRRVNTRLDTLGGTGKYAALTGHSFRRGGAQAARRLGAGEERVLSHFRWRQLATMFRYLQRQHPDAVDPVCSQPGLTQAVAALDATSALIGRPLPAGWADAAVAARGPAPAL